MTSALSFLQDPAIDGRALPGAGLGWMDARRRAGLAEFERLGLPTQRLESWKYTKLRPLMDTLYGTAGTAAAPAVGPVPSVAGGEGPRAVFVNGRLDKGLSRFAGLPDGVRFGPLEAALADDAAWVEARLGAVAGDAEQAMLALNTAMMDSGFVLHVPKGVEVARPIEVVYLSGMTDTPSAYFPRNLIVLEENSRAVLVKHHTGGGVGAYFANAVTEIDVGAGASLKHYKVQAETLYATHISTLHARVGRAATFESFCLSVGGLLSRTEATVRLVGEGAEASVNGAYLMRGSEHCDNTTLVDMAVPHTTCRETFKGVLDDESRAVFQGKIIVREGAQKADGRQLSKTLLLSNMAEIDAKPELEIYADDVQCAHGATSGQLDETSLFYLRSRGIPEALARNMLVQSFLGDALDTISEDAVRDAFAEHIRHWLPAHCYLAG